MKRCSIELLFFGILASLFCLNAAAQSGRVYNSDGSIHHDPTLLDKLYKHDFAAIKDAHWSRIDQGAVMEAFGAAGCAIKKVSPSELPEFLPAFMRYVNSGDDVGDGPSSDPAAVFLAQPLLSMHPTYQATMAALLASKCDSSRMQTIGSNVVELIKNRIAWHQDNGAAKAIFIKQTIRPLTQAGLPFTVLSTPNKQVQDQMIRQIDDLGSKGAKLIDCEYGPTLADGGGSTSLTFWYKEVPIPMGEVVKLSRKHPLSQLGDLAITTCPGTLKEGNQKLAQSRQLGYSKVDMHALPAEPIEMNERTMGNSNFYGYQNALKSWKAYEISHRDQDLKEAKLEKKLVIEHFAKICEFAHRDGRDDRAGPCVLTQQLKDELADIPVDSSEAAAPSLLPAGSRLIVTTIDPIDLGGIDAGHQFRAQIQNPVQVNGKVILATGTDVYLKVSRMPPSGGTPRNIVRVTITVDHVNAGNHSVALTTTELFHAFRESAVEDGHERSSARPLRDTQVPPQSRLSFMTVAAKAN